MSSAQAASGTGTSNSAALRSTWAAERAPRQTVATAGCLGARCGMQVERNAALFDTPVPEQAWQELVAEGLLRETAPVPA